MAKAKAKALSLSEDSPWGALGDPAMAAPRLHINLIAASASKIRSIELEKNWKIRETLSELL